MEKKDRLLELREELNELDRRIRDMLNQRAAISLEVGKLKKQNDGGVLRPMRERQLLEALAADNPGPLPDSHLQAIYREILSSSRSLQSYQQVACLGPEGTFSCQAGRALLGGCADFLFLDDLPAVFEAVCRGHVQMGVVPLENSLQGTVGQSLDLFFNHQVFILSEVFFRISHSLLSKSEALSEIKTVVSHYQPLDQCGTWLMERLPSARLITAGSTAAAAKLAAEAEAGNGLAAIAHKSLAKAHNLSILADRLEGAAENWTRFVIIGQRPGEDYIVDKISMLFTLPDQPGALARVLTAFAAHGINLKKLESRPLKGKRWQYVFFVDLENGPEGGDYQRLLVDLEKQCHSLRVLGRYPQGTYLE